MDHQIKNNQTDEPARKDERKRHGNVGFVIISVALLLVIVGMIIFLILHAGGGKDQTPLAGDASFEVAEDTPKSMADQIEAKKETQEATEESGAAGSTEATEETTEASGESTEATEESKTEESKAEETKAEESKVEESKTEESKTEESKAEESKVEQSKAEEQTKPVKTSTDPETRVIDFATLQSTKNAHIYAWISVPGTNIDYPVLRHPTDDRYYLYHNLNGSQGYPGCIYTENCNSMDWTDPVTVLYGHDMRSTGTMFHQLHKFETKSFFDKHEYFYIYTPEKTLKYQIFSAYVHSNEHLLGNHNFSNKEVFDTFFSTVLATEGGSSHVRSGVAISSDSKIVTLSTCIKNKPENRYLIFGVLVN